MLSYTEELRDRVLGLLEDVGPLHTVAALGFADARAERVRDCLGAVGADRRCLVQPKISLSVNSARPRASETQPSRSSPCTSSTLAGGLLTDSRGAALTPCSFSSSLRRLAC